MNSKIVIFGSTGTIGVQTLDLCRQYPERFSCVGISGFCNQKLLEEQLNKFKPKYVAFPDDKVVCRWQKIYPDIIFFKGKNCFVELASMHDYDIALMAIVGLAALAPALAVLKNNKDIALASKEILVAAGHIVNEIIKEKKTNIYPVDSEHAAIDMCLSGYDFDEISNMILTSSGGALRNYNSFENVTIEEVLKHPNWKMGQKITVDSATLVNKGLEIIEAHYLFQIPFDKIKVLIHPQSIVHGCITLNNGVVISQMSVPDMKIAIAYALSKGQVQFSTSQPLDLTKFNLEFREVDKLKYPALGLAYYVGKKGHSWPTVFNSANEEAVDLFLKKRISFHKIVPFIEHVLEKHQQITNPYLSDILEVDAWSRLMIKELING